MSRIAVIDYGMGNLRSVSKALENVAPDAQVVVSAEAAEIQAASHIVFPGVGAIRDCMSELQSRDLLGLLKQAASEKPFLGICLGMQAMLSFSEENNGVTGLGLFSGQVRYFKQAAAAGLKVPHMGWNQVYQRQAHPLWQGIADTSRFYFVHSYYADPDKTVEIAGESSYAHSFTAALARDNIFAVQFHPEKSQHAGLQLLKNFVQWDGQV
ncbi:Imidazole glycerol phosphate synthase amidotransferase subunit [Methylophaga frappieri]|uniref:Imidazole glycerol phosphate synthase subunit HisH n=1 Tax=Methylophaga frappieri (strain ATCC BAA-2434 / DSM 25690 / JAM7) TaxID=754477 RepID=I1YJN1_METFJ|nr:imidazole glycerol phosphate synthase subunit HisH [Methylophaga frappieri]AFJ03124.1 Imidazole glycerol phosphate synthase amidotransferase subunit [Methylophaga frappieri]